VRKRMIGPLMAAATEMRTRGKGKFLVEFVIGVDGDYANVNSTGLERFDPLGMATATMQKKGTRFRVVTDLGDQRATSAEFAATMTSLSRRRRQAVLGMHTLSVPTPAIWEQKDHVTITWPHIIYVAGYLEIVRELT
jgi:hypothetical protein